MTPHSENIEKFTRKQFKKIVKELEPHCLYLVEIAHSKYNVIHQCYLDTGFNRFPPDWELYSSNYEDVIKLNKIYETYYLKPIKLIHKRK